MPLRECIRAHTYREYRTWMAWLDRDLDRPGKTEWYLMRVAQRVQQVLSSKGISLNDQRIEFGQSNQTAQKMDIETADAISKSVWRARLGKLADKFIGKNNKK